MPYLPSEYESDHELCKFLIMEIEVFLTKEDFKDLKIQNVKLPDNELPGEGEHLLDFLLRKNQKRIHDQILVNHLTTRLIADICYFVFEALEASRRKRLTVTFALLRKPFVSNLKILLRLFLTNDFLTQFNSEEKFEADRISDNQLQELLRKSEKVIFSKALKAEDVYNQVFNPNEQSSLLNISNQALHPSTTRNKLTMTEPQNLNFIFSIEEDIYSQWKFLYARLPFFLLYLLEILEFGIFNSNQLNPEIYIERLKRRDEFIKKNGC